MMSLSNEPATGKLFNISYHRRFENGIRHILSVDILQMWLD